MHIFTIQQIGILLLVQNILSFAVVSCASFLFLIRLT
jgi:hypothetical protein